MAYLFSTNKKGTVLFHEDAMNLCPEFAILDDKEKLALVLITDYDSPYNQLPEIERKHKACSQVFNHNKIDIFERSSFKHAVDLYKSLQYNPKRELIKTYNDKLQSLSNDLINASSPIAIKNILDSQDKIRKVLFDLQQELMDNQEAKYTLKGGGKLSFLEELMQNKEAYERVTSSRNK